MEYDEPEKTCCCYFSIETGVHLILGLSMLTMCVQFFSMVIEGFWAEYLILYICNGVFCFMFLAPKWIKSMDTYMMRLRTMMFYFCAIACLGHLWTAAGLLGIGVDELDYICIDKGIAETYYNGDKIRCRDDWMIILLIALFSSMICQLYYTYILKVFADEKKREEDPNQGYSASLYRKRKSRLESNEVLYEI